MHPESGDESNPGRKIIWIICSAENEMMMKSGRNEKVRSMDTADAAERPALLKCDIKDLPSSTLKFIQEKTRAEMMRLFENA